MKQSWIDKHPLMPGVLTIGYVFFGLIVVTLAIYIPSIGNDIPRFFNIVSYVLIIGPILLTVLQIMNLKHSIASIPRLAFLYLEIILMFGVIYFYSVSSRHGKENQSVNQVKSQTFIRGIDRTWVSDVQNSQMGDRNSIMKKALVCFHDCIHFSLITSTTVGYGDMTPVTPMAKVLVDIQVLLSFFLIAFGAGYLFSKQGRHNRYELDEIKKRIESIEHKIKK